MKISKARRSFRLGKKKRNSHYSSNVFLLLLGLWSDKMYILLPNRRHLFQCLDLSPRLWIMEFTKWNTELFSFTLHELLIIFHNSFPTSVNVFCFYSLHFFFTVHKTKNHISPVVLLLRRCLLMSGAPGPSLVSVWPSDCGALCLPLCPGDADFLLLTRGGGGGDAWFGGAAEAWMQCFIFLTTNSCIDFRVNVISSTKNANNFA